MKRQTPLLWILFLLLLGIGCRSALETTTQSDTAVDTAAFRFIHTLPEPEVTLLFDDTPLTELPWREGAFRPFWLHPYLEYAAGAYALTAVAANAPENQLTTQAVTLEADHQYTLILYETGDGNAQLLWIDETVALEDHNLKEEAVYILANIIDGSEPLRVEIEGETTLDDVAYGSYKVGVDPPGPVDGVQIYSGDELLFDYPDVETVIPGAYFLQIYDIIFGRPQPFPIPTFYGEVAVEAGESLAVDEIVNGRIPGTGTRVQHALSLDDETAVVFALTRSDPPQDGLDSHLELRLYDGDSQLLYQTIDDMVDSLTIESQPIVLSSGNYTVEVSKAFDVGEGAYSVSIKRD